MIEIICQDCERVVAAPNNATLYCNVDRLKRNLWAFGTGTAKCSVPGCGTRFCPIVARDRHCYKHRQPALPGLGRYHVKGTCELCKDDGATLYSSEVPVCIRCLRRPDQRRELMDRVQALADALARQSDAG